MKKIFIILVLLTIMSLLFTLTSCNQGSTDTTVSEEDVESSPKIEYHSSASYTIYTFEEICDFATDVVIATFEGHRPYSVDDYSVTEYTFNVKDRILGNSADVIKVYTQSSSDDMDGFLYPISIYPKYEYILILENETTVYDNTVIYSFILNTAINLTDPNDSMAYGQCINKFSTFDFVNSTREDTIDYISELVKDNTPSIPLEESPTLDTVINNSENIVSVKVNKCDLTSTDVFHDIGYYYCTVTEVFKGDLIVGREIRIILDNKDLKDTDEIIVAFNKGSNTFYSLSTKNSAFPITHRSVIIDAISRNKE